MKPHTTETAPTAGKPLWLELPPQHGGAPNRLLVFLHGAGSRPEVFMPVALAWQFKFPAASAIVLEGLTPGKRGRGYDWYAARGTAREQSEHARLAASEVTTRIRTAQTALNLGPEHTMVIGFSQGAAVALEVGLQAQPCSHIVVSYAGRLLRTLPPGIRIEPSIHLLHGEFDTHVLARQSQRAFRHLREAGARVSVDILAEGVHSIGQDMINVGTMRAMQTVFRARKRIDLDQFHSTLALSMDSDTSANKSDMASSAAPSAHH